MFAYSKQVLHQIINWLHVQNFSLGKDGLMWPVRNSWRVRLLTSGAPPSGHKEVLHLHCFPPWLQWRSTTHFGLLAACERECVRAGAWHVCVGHVHRAARLQIQVETQFSCFATFFLWIFCSLAAPVRAQQAGQHSYVALKVQATMRLHIMFKCDACNKELYFKTS